MLVWSGVHVVLVLIAVFWRELLSSACKDHEATYEETTANPGSIIITSLLVVQVLGVDIVILW